MSPEADKQKTVEQVVRELGHYSLDAFEFLHSGLDYTVREMHGPPPSGTDKLLEWLHSYGVDAVVADLRRLIEQGDIPQPIVDVIRSLGGLDATAKSLNRHVSGEDLCWGLRDLAEKQWGLMASTVLRRWGIRCTKDFGRMIFALVENGLLQKQPDDHVDDFDDVYDFEQVFEGSYEISLSKSPNGGHQPE